MRISKYLTVTLPEDFEPESLPNFKEWVKALESGKFPQTEKVLCERDLKTNKILGYCCLGVLSCIQKRLNLVGPLGGRDYDGINDSLLSSSNPAAKVFGVSARFPLDVEVFYKGEVIPTLVDLNDSGAKFATIAKLIRILWKP